VIMYNNLVNSCHGTVEIEFECDYWKNPIYQDIVTDFFVTTYDSDGNVINTLQNDGELNAESFTPIEIPTDNFDKQFDV